MDDSHMMRKARGLYADMPQSQIKVSVAALKEEGASMVRGSVVAALGRHEDVIQSTWSHTQHL